MSKTQVSVVIPAYNAARYIRCAIRSILDQTSPADEIIVVDDGSTDGTAEAARAAGPNVKVAGQPNSGPSAARNKGLELAGAPLVAFLDSDDVWLPKKIELQRKLLDGEASGAVTAYSICDDELKPVQTVPAADLDKYKPLDFVTSPRALPSTLMIDRRVAGDVRFPENIVDGEDPVFFGILRARGPLRGVDEILALRRRHKSQLTYQGGHFARSLQNRIQWIRQNYPLLGLDSAAGAEREFWRAAANDVLNRWWIRDFRTYEMMRKELLELWPAGHAFPEEFPKRVLPCWAYHLKDFCDRLFR